MNNTVSTIERNEVSGAQQLTLLSVPDVVAVELRPSSAPTRFRLSETTRQRGLAHVAEIRRQLAESQAEREAAHANPLLPRRRRAA